MKRHRLKILTGLDFGSATYQLRDIENTTVLYKVRLLMPNLQERLTTRYNVHRVADSNLH